MILAMVLAAAVPARATVFATVRGVVHDPEHRPIAHAQVTLQSAHSAFVLHAVTNSDGEFQMDNAPLGVYRLSVSARDFETVTQALTLASGTSPILHVELPIGAAKQSVVVYGDSGVSYSVTPTTLV
ncbi:MAG: carboxypeptidase-like regulatory domain-containing protein, partial [Terracidiphilus sp.]